LEEAGELGVGGGEGVEDEAGHGAGALFVEVGEVGGLVGEFLGVGGAEFFDQGGAGGVQVDDGDFFLGGDGFHGVGVGLERVGEFAVWAESAADHRGDKDRGRVNGTGIVDVTTEEIAVGGRGVGGLGFFRGVGIVVTELDEDVVGFFGEGLGPATLGDEGLGAASGGGEIDDGDGAGLEFFGDELAPATVGAGGGVITNGGVTDEDDADGCGLGGVGCDGGKRDKGDGGESLEEKHTG
jgi:hypothetical protein